MTLPVARGCSFGRRGHRPPQLGLGRAMPDGDRPRRSLFCERREASQIRFTSGLTVSRLGSTDRRQWQGSRRACSVATSAKPARATHGCIVSHATDAAPRCTATWREAMFSRRSTLHGFHQAHATNDITCNSGDTIMKITFTAALFAAGLAFAGSASANTYDRGTTGSVLSDRSLNTASVEQSATRSHVGGITLASSSSATGGPSGGPNQAGG